MNADHSPAAHSSPDMTRYSVAIGWSFVARQPRQRRAARFSSFMPRDQVAWFGHPSLGCFSQRSHLERPVVPLVDLLGAEHEAFAHQIE
jgi:hypothetical protein